MKQTIKRQSLTEQVQAILIDRIVDGTLAPGTRLKELQIAEELGTSQAPVREAIRSLQALGYVEHKPYAGALVKKFSQQDMQDAYEIREALEVHSLLRAQMPAKELGARLRTHLDQMNKAQQANDVGGFTKADNQFHSELVHSLHNERMMAIWQSLGVQLQVLTAFTEASITLESLYDLHPEIVQALENGDREEAATMLIRHFKGIQAHWKELGHL